MKTILSLIISAVLIVSGFGQTRNVLVGTNNVVVQPTNFWSADASNARAGLGLGSAATSAVSAFQPASSVLTNLSASNGGNLTNISIFNIIGTLGVSQGGTGSTNASAARTALGLGTAATNASSAFQPSSTVLSNLSSSNGSNLTNIPLAGVVGALSTNGNGAGLTNLTASNITGTIAVSNGGTGATNAAIARTNLGLGWSALTNTNAATAFLGFETNGQIVYGSTNTLTFTNNVNFASGDVQFSGTQIVGNGLSIDFDDGAIGGGVITLETNSSIAFQGSAAATTRTNLGLGWQALTNSNAGTGLVSVNTNGEVVSPTNFWQQAPIATTVAFSAPATNSTNTATNSRNLIIQSLSSNIVNTTNTLLLPTNTSTFNGDTAVVIHAGGSGSETAIRQAGSATNLIVLTNFDHAVRFLYFNNAWDFYHNLAYVEPIYFSGTNAVANAATSRTNLGLGATWLTNTNVTNFRTAIGLGSANAVSFSTVAAQEIYDSVGNKVIDLENFILGVGTTAALEWATNQVQVNVPILFNGTNSASATRTNLGLGTFKTTDGDVFSEIYSGSDLRIVAGDSIEFFESFSFGGTNSADYAGNSRTSLGLGLPALTNTSNANFRNAIELGATNNVSFSNVTASGTLTATGTVTATTNLVVNGLVDFSTNHTNSNPATNNQINDFIEIRVGTNQFWLPVYK
jgi:hypothetical protein